MFLINTRKDGHDARLFSAQDRLTILDQDLESSEVGEHEMLAAFQSRKLLLLIHGFNNSMEDILQEYALMETQIEQYTEQAYDAIVGFSWPSGANGLDYFRARDNTTYAGRRLRYWLKRLSKVSGVLDIIGHSMAAQVGRNAFHRDESIKVRNIFSMGAAINTSLLNQDTEFDQILDSCNRIYMLYTEKDRILKYAYRFVEWHNAVGYSGRPMTSLNDEGLSKIHVVDCSNVISDHTEYKRSPEVFQFISSSLNEEHQNAKVTLTA